MEDKPQRQIKHMEILHRMEILEAAVGELWSLVYRVNPGLASPKGEVEVATSPSKITLSEFFMMMPEKVSSITGGLREAIETLDKELH